MKNLIIQVNIPSPNNNAENVKKMFHYNRMMYEMSIESVKDYSKRIGVDYELITEMSIYSHPAYERFQIFDNQKYDVYDNILYVDCDFFFHRQTPNFFEWAQQHQETFFATPDTLKNYNYFNSGFFMIKKGLRQRVKGLIIERYRSDRETLVKDQDILNRIIPSSEWCRISRDWNGVMSIYKPKFGLHYVGMKKDQFDPKKHIEIMKEKERICSRLTSAEKEAMYIQKRPIVANSLF